MILDDKLVAEAKGLMKDKFGLMVQYFVEDTEAYVADVNAGFVDCDYKRIGMAAHTIKSSARQIGAVDLSDLGKVIEVFAVEGKRVEIEGKLVELGRVFAETKTALVGV